MTIMLMELINMDNFKELYEDQDKSVIKRVQKESEIVILNNQDKEIQVI